MCLLIYADMQMSAEGRVPLSHSEKKALIQFFPVPSCWDFPPISLPSFAIYHPQHKQHISFISLKRFTRHLSTGI